MTIEFPGTMNAFANLELCAIFVYFDETKSRAYGMKVEQGVLSFSKAIRPDYTPPMILPIVEFQNRDVLVLENVAIRPAFKGTHLHDGSPPEAAPGSVIFASDGVFIRAWPFGAQRTQDVDLNTGAIGAAFAHPGGIWSDDWKIVLADQPKEIVLCERGKPAAKK